jgi:hypothetical protein
MGIAHVTNFEKPAISPFSCIFLELIEGQFLKDGGRILDRPHLRYLGSFLLLGLF